MITGASRTLTDGRFAVLPWQEHLQQSIGDILSTPIGTRVMRPEYGSKCPRLVDRPINQSWKLEVYVAIVEALGRWEPRIRVKQVRVLSAGAGYMEIAIDYIVIETNEPATMYAKVGAAA